MNKDIILFTVPIQWKETYDKLCVLMTDNALDIVKDCDKSCKGANIKLLECWNMFQSACCAITQDMIDEANFLYKYVTEQINLTYKTNIEVKPYTITTEEIEDGTN